MSRHQPKITINSLNNPSQQALGEFKKYIMDIYYKYSD